MVYAHACVDGHTRAGDVRVFSSLLLAMLCQVIAMKINDKNVDDDDDGIS